MQPAATYPIKRCLYHELTEREKEQMGRAGENIRMAYVYILFAQVPDSLKEPSAASSHQVTNILYRRGQLVDAGPFDIESIHQPEGVEHHMRLLLKRIA